MIGCIECTGYISPEGYGQATSFGRLTTAHRAVMEKTLGRRLGRYELVCHKCDNRRCINPEHLFLGTHRDNFEDMCTKGRAKIRLRAKLSAADVQAIRAAPTVRGSGTALARQYGVSGSTIHAVRTRRYYRHV